MLIIKNNITENCNWFSENWMESICLLSNTIRIEEIIKLSNERWYVIMTMLNSTKYLNQIAWVKEFTTTI